MIKYIATLALTLTFVSSAIVSHAEQTVTFALFSRGWAPFEMVEADQGKGAFADVFKVVMPNSIKSSVAPLNKPRLNLYTKSAPVYCRLEAPEWMSKEREYWWSDPVLELSDVLISPASAPVDYHTPMGLEGMTIGCIRNYYYPKLKRLFKEKKAIRYDVNMDIILLRMAKEGRLDGVVLNKETALWLIRQHEDLDFSDFHIAETPVDTVKLSFVFNRVPGWDKHLPEINANIKKIREDGTLDAILARYK